MRRNYEAAQQLRLSSPAAGKAQRTYMAQAPKLKKLAGSGRARVPIVDDQPIVRQGLAELICNQSDLTLAGDLDDPQIAISAHGAYEKRAAAACCCLLKRPRPRAILLRVFGKTMRMAALVFIALAGCASSFASIDWDGDPDTPDSIDIVVALPPAPEAKVLLQNKALIPREMDLEPSTRPASEIFPVQPGPVQNFYCLHEHVPERAPPTLR
jgi:hypothetical protein